MITLKKAFFLFLLLSTFINANENIADKVNNLTSYDSLFDEKEKKYLENKSTIKMCVDPNWMPFERINEQHEHEGMASDILNTVQERTGITLELIPTKNWQESIDFAKARKCDIYSLAMQTPRRQKYMNFTKPYLSFPFVIATQVKELFVENLESIVDKPLVMVKGYAYVEILKNRYPLIDITEVNSMIEGLKLVQNGKAYGLIDTLATVAYTLQKEGMVDVKISGKFEENWDLAIASRNDEPILNTVLQKALTSITEKEKRDIYNSWFSIKYEQRVDYSLIWKILSVSFIIFVFILYWNRKLTKLNKKLHIANEELKNAQEILSKIAITDSLTGLYNRNKLNEELNNEYNRAIRFNQSFGIIIMDIDYFKDINDTFGHQAGDGVLIKIASLLQENTRKVDTVGRWGGEEFFIICPKSDLDGVINVAESLKSTISKHKFPIVGYKTASFGVTTYKAGDTIERIISRADAALYKAKKSGRDNVEDL